MERNAPAVRDCNTLPGSFSSYSSPSQYRIAERCGREMSYLWLTAEESEKRERKEDLFLYRLKCSPIFPIFFLRSIFSPRIPLGHGPLQRGKNFRQAAVVVSRAATFTATRGGGRKELLFRPGNFMQSGFTRTEQRGRRKGRWRWWRGPLF